MSSKNSASLLLLFAVATGVVVYTIHSLNDRAKKRKPISKQATFGAGCYWGTEKYFKKDFGTNLFVGTGKITSGKVGFMGGPDATQHPTYKEVCKGDTKQVEVFDLEFDGDDTTYENLVKHFFMFHDPTTLHRQEEDVGFQYSSIIYVYDEKQRAIANKVKKELQQLLDAGKVKYSNKEVVTEIADATTFFPAHEEHQEYLDKNPTGWCVHRYRFKEWPSL